MKKWIIILTTIFLLTILTATFWAYSTFFYTTPITQQELKHLTPDWTKATQGNWSPWHTDPTDPTATKAWNPAASFNTWLETVPEQDKAWPIIVDVRYSNLDFYLNENIGSYPQELRDWNSLADTIRSQSGQTIIDRTAQALNRPVMGCGLYAGTGQIEHDALLRHGRKDPDWQPNQRADPPISILWQPSLGLHRSSTRWLQTGAIVALLDGDSDRFISLHETILNSAHLSNEYPNLISQLVYMAIVAEGAESIRWAIQYHPEKLNSVQLSKLDTALAQHASLKFIWQGEALLVHDFFRRIGDTDGHLSMAELLGKKLGNGLPVEGPATNLPDSQMGSSITRPLHLYNKILQQASTNTSMQWHNISQSALSVYKNESHTLNSVTRIFIETLAPSIDRSVTRFRMHHQDIAATRAIIAVHQYKLRTNNFPDSLQDLDSDPKNFTDEFTGKPLLYIKSNQGPIIYSVGNNLQNDNATKTQQYQWLTMPQAKDILISDPDSISGDYIYFPEPPMTIKDADDDEEWERKTYGDD